MNRVHDHAQGPTLHPSPLVVAVPGIDNVIIVIGGIKGGTGKTTVTTNLAVLCKASGSVLLIDADEQETASDFSLLRQESKQGQLDYSTVQLRGAEVRDKTLRLRDQFDHILIDTGGRDTTSQRAALSIADVFLAPFIPRVFDMWTLNRVSDLVTEMRAVNPHLRACSFLNRAEARGSDNAAAAEVLSESQTLHFLDTSLGNRKAFANAAGQGLAVSELRPRDPKADGEMRALYQQLFAPGIGVEA